MDEIAAAVQVGSASFYPTFDTKADLAVVRFRIHGALKIVNGASPDGTVGPACPTCRNADTFRAQKLRAIHYPSPPLRTEVSRRDPDEGISKDAPLTTVMRITTMSEVS